MTTSPGQHASERPNLSSDELCMSCAFPHDLAAGSNVREHALKLPHAAVLQLTLRSLGFTSSHCPRSMCHSHGRLAKTSSVPPNEGVKAARRGFGSEPGVSNGNNMVMHRNQEPLLSRRLRWAQMESTGRYGTHLIIKATWLCETIWAESICSKS